MRVHRSVEKHQVKEADMLHAINHALSAVDLDDEPIILHAMEMRRQCRPLPSLNMSKQLNLKDGDNSSAPQTH